MDDSPDDLADLINQFEATIQAFKARAEGQIRFCTLHHIQVSPTGSECLGATLGTRCEVSEMLLIPVDHEGIDDIPSDPEDDTSPPSD